MSDLELKAKKYDLLKAIFAGAVATYEELLEFEFEQEDLLDYAERAVINKLAYGDYLTIMEILSD